MNNCTQNTCLYVITNPLSSRSCIPHSLASTHLKIQNVSRQFHDYEREYYEEEPVPEAPKPTEPPPLKQQTQQQPPEVDEMKQAADEAAKAAQEAAKAAAEASQSLMKGLSSFGGGFGFGFGGKQASTKKPPQQKQAQNQTVMKQGQKLDNQERLLKPCTAGMTARQRWFWAFRKIQQVTHCTANNYFISLNLSKPQLKTRHQE